MNSKLFLGEKKFSWKTKAQSSKLKAQGKFQEPTFNPHGDDFAAGQPGTWVLDTILILSLELSRIAFDLRLSTETSR
jgi:hypothetical protein